MGRDSHLRGLAGSAGRGASALKSKAQRSLAAVWMVPRAFRSQSDVSEGSGFPNRHRDAFKKRGGVRRREKRVMNKGKGTLRRRAESGDSGLRAAEDSRATENLKLSTAVAAVIAAGRGDEK